MNAESAKRGIFVVIREDNKYDDVIASVFEKQESLKVEGTYAPEIVIIDASPKASASKE